MKRGDPRAVPLGVTIVVLGVFAYVGGATPLSHIQPYRHTGPMALLAIPLVQFLVQFLVRGQDPGNQTMAMFGVMLLAFGGAIGAHIWCVLLVQRCIRPDGIPKMSSVIDRLGLTTAWLVGAATWCVVATYAIALVASLMLPCTFRVMSGIGPAVCMLP